MTYENPTSAFRCTVVPEQSSGRLRLGWQRHQIRVLDTSRDAFTLQVSAETFGKLREGSRAILDYHDEVWDVECTAVFRLLDDRFHVSMSRLRDRTAIRGPKSSSLSALLPSGGTADPVLPLALLISFLLACVALPGMGDSLGTAPKIRKAVQDVWRMTTGG